MPFTLSHPAAVLPLFRRPLRAAALVAGAIAPDMAYFVGALGIPVSAQSWYEPLLNATTAHSLGGMVTVDLVYGLALFGLLVMARRPFIPVLPILAEQAHARPTGLRELLVCGGWVLVSLLMGIATHLLWDSFTDGDGVLVRDLAWLGSQVTGDMTWARALQHGSTAIGLVVIGVFLWRRRLLAGTADGPHASRRFRSSLVFVFVSVAAAGAAVNIARGWAATESLAAGDLSEYVLSAGAKGAGAAFLAALIGYVAVWWLWRLTAQRV
ncbi:DUF4184 family protein [Pseudonocardia sp. H11422]|uniref:DUF4184 family protein n=1 Tax=Pseudonocardia sp. H11422 TaxID=2835866 RepID=UPI002112A70A|nr:DUF4184 family protein [Pseudonocardia sp. H11422]